MSKKQRIGSLSRNWLDKIDREEIEQEELIQRWKHPALAGYEGLLAYTELYRRELRNKRRPKTVPLKKNTPGKIIPDVSFDDMIINMISNHSDKGLCSLLIQPWIQEHYYGKDINSIRGLAEYLNIPKSTLHFLLRR